MKNDLIEGMIYFVLITGFFSALYMVYIVYAPPSKGIGPLFKRAKELPHEFMVTRRLYALEAWIIFGALSIFWAIQHTK